MSQKKNYSRSFIILQENEKGHGISSDKLPTGYAKIETRNGKCKVFFYVQNLKGTSKPYYMVLVCNKKDTKKLIRLGELKLDEYGKAEVTREYDANDVGESGISIDRVIGAAVSQFNGNDIIALMSGFNATDVPEDWKTYSIASKKTKEVCNDLGNQPKDKQVEAKKAEVKQVEVKQVETEKVEAKQVEAKKSEVKPPESREAEAKTNEVESKPVPDRKTEGNVDNTEKQSDKKESDNIFDKYEESIENTKKDDYSENINISVNKVKDEKSEENNDELRVEEKEKKCPCCSYDNQNVENGFQDEIPINNMNKDYPIGRTGEFFKTLADDLEDLGEIFQDVRCCRWYKVSGDFRKHKHHKSDYNKYTILYYPMMSYYAYIQKSGCYLVGYKYDEKGKMKYIVYGILGTKNKFDQPFGGRTGFVSWVPMEKGKEGYDDKGCWLMFYDFKNAAILVPRR